MKPNIGQGDRGDTFIIGKKMSKDELTLEVIGTLDELVSFIGLARSSLKDKEIDAVLEKVQNDLFIVGEEFAKISQPPPRTKFSEEHVKWLETSMAELEKELPVISRFILPSGTQEASAIHVARAVCRRCERNIVALKKIELVNQVALSYINRLSDLLFTVARVINKRSNFEEKFWGPEFTS